MCRSRPEMCIRDSYSNDFGVFDFSHKKYLHFRIVFFSRLHQSGTACCGISIRDHCVTGVQTCALPI